MTAPVRPRSPRRGATPRDRAMRLVADGLSLAEAARQVGVHARTVRRWRDSEDGAATLATAKVEAEDAFVSTVEAARAELSAAASAASKAVLEVLTAGAPQDRLRAASMVFDRVGLPRTQRVETEPAPMDTSKLTDDELADLEALLRKAGGT